MPSKLRWGVIVSLAVLSLALHRAWGHWQPLAKAPRADRLQGYAAGPWSERDLGHVALAPAHILIRFAGALEREGDILVTTPPPLRSRAAALRKIREIEAAVRARPADFDRLAREHSEDPLTKNRGGRLGVMRAPSLPPAFVNALGHLAAGEVSHPIETAVGFHLIQRLPVPPRTRVSGSEIVVAYRGVSAALRFGRRVERDREAARQLAEQLADRARRDPSQFSALVAEHSDAPNAVADGDLGEWWTDEVGDAVVLDALRESSVGAVSGPIDDPAYGFRILRRTEPVRETLAASVMLIGYLPEERPDWVDPSITLPLARARELAEQLTAELAAAPERFDALRAEHCDYQICRMPLQAYPAGRSPWIGLDRRLLALPIGGITREPTWTPMGFVIARRETPAGSPTLEPAITELPLSSIEPQPKTKDGT